MLFSQQRRDAELRRLQRVKQIQHPQAAALGPSLVGFFKNSVQKRQTKMGKIAERWQQLVPPLLAEHTALESFSKGSLTVLVDSASHLYELKQLLLAGLEAQLLLACKSAGLRKITLKSGRWYEGESPSQGKPRF